VLAVESRPAFRASQSDFQWGIIEHPKRVEMPQAKFVAVIVVVIANQF
jgi:hypothetical protein